MTYDLQERVNYYNTELSKDYSNDEESLFKILFGLFWETAINPTTNNLILMVFSSKHTSQEKTINSYFYQLFNSLSTPHRVINTYNDKEINTIIKSRGELIISVLFLKFIYYFALRILKLDTSSPNLCEHLSNLADLVGLTDNERILSAAVIDIGNFLMITTESKDEIRAIIDAIHNIFTQQLKIDIPDNISIQITISVICKHKLKELECPTEPDDTPKPEIVSRSWNDTMALVSAKTAAGITRKIVKTELVPLSTLTDETSKGRYAPPQLGMTKTNVRQQRLAHSLLKAAPAAPVFSSTLPYRVPEAQARNRGITKNTLRRQQQRIELSFPKGAPAAPVFSSTLPHRVPEAQSRNRGTHSENKPVCRYSSACYITNPYHLRKYYHPPPGQPDNPKRKSGGGSGKSTRTCRRYSARTTRHRPSTKHTRHRPSTKRSSIRR